MGSDVSAPVRLERDGAVAVIVLDAPPLNLFSDAAWHALVECIAEVEASDARALVWRGTGKLFSGGVDVRIFQGIIDGGRADADSVFAPLLETVRRLEALPIPTLALCHGVCLTAAFEIALGCDMIWAGESTRFGLVERVVGLTPGAGGTQRLAERAGPGRAREFVMSGDLYKARTLEAWNVVNRVLPDSELHERGLGFAHRLAGGPTLAHAATKRIVRACMDGGRDGADAITAHEAGELFRTEDLKDAVAAFLRDGPGSFDDFHGR